MEPGVGFSFSGTERFEIRRRLGSGGMGVVYEAVDRERGSRVALKTLRHLTPHALYRFKQEFRALQDIVHPNLVSLGELIEAGGQWFFTMELVDGVDFLEHVRTEGAPAESDDTQVLVKFDEARLRAALEQLARGLVALHGAGKVHRDVKPSNIRVTSEGRLVLLDFGVIAQSSEHTTEAEVVGTAAYMAPEQAASGRARPSADWYSVGVLMYQALTGALPFLGQTPMEILLAKRERRPAPPRKRAPGVPADLSALCEQLLEPDPEHRPSALRITAALGAHAPDAPAPRPARTTSAEYAPFVGRDRELAELRDAFDAVTRGATVTMCVRGESGIGKSALIREFLAGLDRDDVAVLSGRCYERETVPYKAFDGVIDALARVMKRMPAEEAAALLPRNAALLPRVFPVLARVEAIAQAPPPAREVRDPVELRERVFAALRELMALLAERYPVVITIDDLQWADADSLLLLSDLLAPPDAPPLLLLTSSRTKAVTPLPGDVRNLPLEPLARAAATQLATELLEQLRATGRVSAGAIADEAHGHPLFIDELVRHVADSDADEPPHLRLDDAICARVELLAEPARRVLQLVALAGSPIPQTAVRHAAEIEPPEFSKLVSVLRVAHLVRSSGSRGADAIEAYHDRVREAISDHVDDAARAQLHERLVRGLETSGIAEDRPDLLVRHLEGAGHTERAAACAEAEGHRAAEALAFDRAIELFRTALRLGHLRGEKEREARYRLAFTLANAGHGADAADEFMRAAEGADRIKRLECQSWACNLLLITGHVDRGLATTKTLLSEVGLRYPRSPFTALIGVLWRRLWIRLRGYDWKDTHARDIPAKQLARLDAMRSASEGLALIEPVRGMYFHTRSLIMALGLGEWMRVGRVLGFEAVYLASQGLRSHVREQRMIDQLQRIFDKSGEVYVKIGALVSEGIVEFMSARFRTANDLLARAEARMHEQPIRPTLDLNTVRLFRLYALRQTGHFAEGQRLLDEYLRDSRRRGDLYADTTLRRANTLFWLARDDPRGAIDNLENTTWTSPAKGWHVQHWYELDGRAHTALYEGDVPAKMAELAPGFRAMRRSLMSRVQMLRLVSTWLWGRCALAMAEAGASFPNGKPPAWGAKQAAKMAKRLEREHLDLARMMALMLRAGLAGHRGDRTDAANLLRDAARAAEANDVQLVAECARRCRGKIVGGGQGEELVSRAEEWMTREGIANPERFMRIVTPGLGALSGPDPR